MSQEPPSMPAGVSLVVGVTALFIVGALAQDPAAYYDRPHSLLHALIGFGVGVVCGLILSFSLMANDRDFRSGPLERQRTGYVLGFTLTVAIAYAVLGYYLGRRFFA